MTTSNVNNEKQTSIPKWIFWFGIIVMIGAPLYNIVMTIGGPNLGSVTLTDGSIIETGLFKYAVRNIAAVVITAFALYKRSAAMLIIVFITRYITEAGDLLDAVLFGNLDSTSTLIYVAMMVFLAFIPYTLALRQLWPLAAKEEKTTS